MVRYKWIHNVCHQLTYILCREAEATMATGPTIKGYNTVFTIGLIRQLN